MPRPGPQIRLRIATWNAEQDRIGNKSCAARAKHIGMDHSLVCRLEAGTTIPGNRFIAAVLTAFPRRKFEHFFEVTRGDAA
jgi:hypothetical protein